MQQLNAISMGGNELSAVAPQKVTLVFPAVGEEALAYVRTAKAKGEMVVCASSIAGDTAFADFGSVRALPSIHDLGFQDAFLALVAQEFVGVVFSPVSTVYAFLRQFLPAHCPGVQLIGDSPVQRQMDQHRLLMSKAAIYYPWIEMCAEIDCKVSRVDVAAVLRQASLIYGESNDEKLAAMMGVFATAPFGDVVEIGSLMGRSAFVLLFLARHFSIGNLLTIDPWSALECTQNDSPSTLQLVSDEWDYEVIREGFAVNLAAFGFKDNAHLRMPSSDGFSHYDKTSQAMSLGGHRVSYTGKVAVIHIDGNHDYSSVKQDCQLWLSKLTHGAWLILDDYIWAHGDGPYHTGNELLREEAARIDRAFVSGKALFVKFR